MAWRIAGTVFRGSTQEAKVLAGKRVRTRRALLSSRIYDPDGKKDETTDLDAQAEGIIGHVPAGQFDQILIAFPLDKGIRLTSLDQAMRQRLVCVLVNWPTFRDAFDIDG
jgi:hypothetical protein